MKSENNNPETVNVNPENVENAQTPEQAKAAAILRERMPELTAAAANFEKRRRVFFFSTEQTKEDGTKYNSRNVVDDADVLAKATDSDAMAAEMAMKRHAANVAMYDIEKALKAKAVEEARAALKAAEAEAEQLDAVYTESVAAVMAYELPEKPAAERVTLKATVAKQADELAAAAAELERLKALLASAGIEA
jgi:hypothetical protein